MMKNKVLILDDDTATLDVLGEALGQENIEVQTCSRSADFFKFLKDFRPGLVLVDYLLEGINGGELCHRIKHTAETAGIPVIMMSAYPRVFLSIGDYGCDAFVAKPFDLFGLINLVKKHLAIPGA